MFKIDWTLCSKYENRYSLHPQMIVRVSNFGKIKAH